MNDGVCGSAAQYGTVIAQALYRVLDIRWQAGRDPRTGLSLRTIRHYEEVGLLPEAQRSQGGFRLYGEEAVQRLLVIKQMKPLEFTLEEMRDLLEVLDRLAAPRLSPRTRAGLLDRLAAYGDLVEHKLV